MRVSRWGNSLAVRLPVPVVEALELVEGDEVEIDTAHVLELTHAIHRRVAGIAQADGLSIHDAQVVVAALTHDAPIHWREDLQDGRQFDGRLTVQKLFLDGPSGRGGRRAMNTPNARSR